MLVPQKQCKWCQAVRKDKKLLERIYNSSFFIPHGKESLKMIANDTGGTYNSLKTHVNKHQFIDSQDYNEKMLKQIDKAAEKRAVQKAVKAVDAVQSIIDKGMQRLEDGEITVDTNQLIKASQVKITQESKAKDQELATVEMIAHFLSGEARTRMYLDPEPVIEQGIDVPA